MFGVLKQCGLRASHSDRALEGNTGEELRLTADIRSSLLQVKNSRCTVLPQEIFDTFPLDPHFVGGTSDQSVLPWDSGETLQFLTCGRTFKGGLLVLFLSELQDVLPHPWGSHTHVLALQNKAFFPRGAEKRIPFTQFCFAHKGISQA